MNIRFYNNISYNRKIKFKSKIYDKIKKKKVRKVFHLLI